MTTTVTSTTALGTTVIPFRPDGVGTTITPFFHISSPGLSASQAPSPIHCVVWAPTFQMEKLRMRGSPGRLAL